MSTSRLDQDKAQLRAGVYARLSETYDAAESVPIQLERGEAHTARRGWRMAARFKEITRDGFAEPIGAIESGRVDVVIARDVDRLTRNLTDWNRFEKACVRHGVLLSPYTGADLDPVHTRGRPITGDGDAAGQAAERGQRRLGPRGPPTATPGRASAPRRVAVARLHPHLRQPHS